MYWKRRKRKIQTAKGCAYALMTLSLLALLATCGVFVAYLHYKGLI